MGARLSPEAAKIIPITSAHGSDEALVRACASGDSAALARLFDRYARPVARFLARLLAGSSEVDDLVQATFMQVWRSAESFKGRSSVRVWIFGIAYNLGRRDVRGHGRRRALLDAFSLAPVAPERPLDELTHDRRTIERVVESLQTMSAEHRAAVIMVDLEGMASVEAAEALGVRPGTFGRRLFEARRRLRDELAEERR